VPWTVKTTKKAQRQIEKLPDTVRAAYAALARELELLGPYRSNWSHYGKLRGTKSAFHCHIVSGRPTYVVCWDVTDKNIRLLEVYYVGTHEGAPY
jgi:mRNA-degrading endonuclease RelE of RelBE toxin-antitoxin system